MPNILKVNASDAVDKIKVESSLRSLIESAPVDPNWKLAGPAKGKNFVLEFAGTVGFGTTQAAALMEYIRNGGSWRDVMVEGSSSKLFISYDKSPRQMAMEAAGRRLIRICKATVPGRADELHLHRPSAKISVGWTPLVKVMVDGPKASHLQWNMDAVAQFNIDTEAIKSAYLDFSGEDQVLWTRG